MSTKHPLPRKRRSGAASILATLVTSVSSLEQTVVEDRRRMDEENRLIHVKLAGLASSIESLEKTVGENRQAIITQNQSIEKLARSISFHSNGQSLEPTIPGTGTVAHVAPAPVSIPFDGLKEIDRDILRVASFTTPYMGKQLAARTQKYKFNPYFRSRLSYLYKNSFLKRSGEGYFLAASDICPA